MIAKQAIGKSFNGALNYNLKKVYSTDIKNRAELLTTNFLSLNKTEIRKELAIMKALNPNLKRNTYHTSLNFSVEEKISNGKMEAIAKEYMVRMGFDNNPYFIFRHNDAEHPHCHILTLRNRFDGTVVSDSNNYARSEAIVRELEDKYELIKVDASKFSLNKSPDKDELEMINRTGKISEKMLMQEKVAIAIKTSKNIKQFIDHLERSGISLLFNQATTGKVSGITFISQNFKARGQALGNQFKWGKIINKLDYEQIRDRTEISQGNFRTRERYNIGNGSENTNTTRSLPTFGSIYKENEFDRERSIQINRIYKGEFSEDDRIPKKSSGSDFEFREVAKGSEKIGGDNEDMFLYDTDHANDIKRVNNFGFDLSIANDEDDSKKRKKMKR